MPCLGRAAQPIVASRVKRDNAEFGTRAWRGGAGNFARARVARLPGEDVRGASGYRGIGRMRNGAGTRGGDGGVRTGGGCERTGTNNRRVSGNERVGTNR
jgi:hypothetical protein